MHTNNPNDYLQEDEIDLKEIFKLLINSKKLIIAITLVITTLGAIYSFQKAPVYKSTAFLEIGEFYSGNDSIEKELIESGGKLIQDININFIFKTKIDSADKLILNILEKKLIKIEYTSSSAENNNNLLNEIIRYINNRHSALVKKNKQQLIYRIEYLNKEIEFLKATHDGLINNLNMYILNLDKQLQLLNKENLDDLSINYIIGEKENQKFQINHLALQAMTHNDTSEKIFRLSKEKDTLELLLALQMKQTPTSSQLIGKIETDTIHFKKDLTIFLSFIFGLLLSIMLVLINYFYKAFKEDQV